MNANWNSYESMLFKVASLSKLNSPCQKPMTLELLAGKLIIVTPITNYPIAKNLVKQTGCLCGYQCLCKWLGMYECKSFYLCKCLYKFHYNDAHVVVYVILW